MKAKTKLIATLMAICLVVTLGVFGILAVKTLNMSVGGNITFSAEGLSLEVFAGQFKTESGGDYSEILTQTGKMQGFVMDTNTKQSDVQDKINSWAGLNLVMNSKGDAVLHFSVKNNMTTPLYVYIETELGENTNDNMDMSVNFTETQIVAGATTEFTVTFDILDTNINAGLTGFEIAVDFEKEEKTLLKTQNKIDENTGLPTPEVDYYYVEMGTYNGQPVKWRYVADANGVKYAGGKITTLSGYFVLETEVDLQHVFLAYEKYTAEGDVPDIEIKHNTQGYTNINANDYGLSDIRAYLRNEGTGGFLNALNISPDNEIYSIITSRTITDLYSAIKEDGTAITVSDTSYSLSLTGDKSISNQSDKLWLMSYNEATTFFTSNAERVWGSVAMNTYWLRSPGAFYHDRVYSDGAIGVLEVDGPIWVRPCFKIA